MTLLSDNAELHGEVELHRRLAELYAALTSQRPSERLLFEVVEAAARALDSEAGALVARDDYERWRIRSTWNMAAPAARSECVFLAEAAIGRRALVAADERGRRLGKDSLRRGSAATVVAIPLSRDAAAPGCLVLYYGLPHRFAPAEIEFVGQVAAGVRAALEHAHLVDQQRSIATTLQESIFHPLPRISGLELGRVSQAAEKPAFVGGDFSDVFALDDAHVGVLIGDVGGRGLRAAGLAETVRTAMAAFCLIDPSPAFVLNKTNELLLRREGDGPFVTALSCLVDLDSGEVRCASAGHPAPLLVGGGGCCYLEVPFGLPLGLQRGEYGDATVCLRAGEGLVLFTDGISEARGRASELFGERGVLEAVNGVRECHPQVIAERLRDTAASYAKRLNDDLEILALRLLRTS